MSCTTNCATQAYKGVLKTLFIFYNKSTCCVNVFLIFILVLGIPLETAVMMATKIPAETVGVYNKKGSLTVGKTADIVILNKDITVKNVILRGKLLS